MKTEKQLVRMQENLRVSMMSLQGSGAPPEIIERSAIALACGDDVLNWVLERPSELAKIEEEYNRKLKERHAANE